MPRHINHAPEPVMATHAEMPIHSHSQVRQVEEIISRLSLTAVREGHRQLSAPGSLPFILRRAPVDSIDRLSMLTL
jgi:hypothetical protein